METVAIGVENLCVPCHAHCRYCLLSSCGKSTGVDYERGKRFAARIYHEMQEKRPELRFFYYIGYCMDSEDLMDYIAFSRETQSPSAEFLQMNGLRLRGISEVDVFISGLVDAGVKMIDLTFYGLREYHDRFAGRLGDFDYLLCILSAAQKYDLGVNASIPVTRENVSELDELLVLLEQRCCGKITVFIPHEKGRGWELRDVRLRVEDLSGLSDKALRCLSNCHTEGEWIANIDREVQSKRTLTLALTPAEIDRLESMSLEEIIFYLEGLDEAYYAAIPSCEELAALYGNPQGTRLYRRFRDLYQEWQYRYLREYKVDVWDVNDETHHFSVRM